jgi:hypothetical protein
MKDIYEATQLSGEEELEVSQKSSPTRPFLDQRSFLFFSSLIIRSGFSIQQRFTLPGSKIKLNQLDIKKTA